MSKKKDLQKKTRKASRRQIEQLAAQIADEMAVGLFGRTEKYAANVGRYYSIAVGELLKLTAGVELDPESEVFSFSGSKRMSEKSNAILRGLYSAVYQEIRNGVVSEWENANAASDRLVELVLGKGVRDDKRFASLFARNREAMDAFFSRKNERGGLNLSQKVWKYTSQFKDEMELALSASLGRGDSAATVSRRVRQYLQEPERLFRRVRDEEGNLKLSKKAAAYHPGQGQYRSSYKNAMRLARTETNMAYRSADYERRQRHPWIVGVEVKRVHDKTVCKLCDELAGVYPKDFKFVGWHPQCRCYTIDVLAPADEVDAYHRAMLNGEDVSGWQFSGQITEPHEGFREWMKENQGRIEKATERGTLPYWVKDNPKYVGVKQVAQPEPIKDIHDQRDTASAELRAILRGEPPHIETYQRVGEHVYVSDLNQEAERAGNIRMALFLAENTGDNVYVLPHIQPKSPNAERLRREYFPEGVKEDKNPDLFFRKRFVDEKSMNPEDVSDAKKTKRKIQFRLKEAFEQADDAFVEIPTIIPKDWVEGAINGKLKSSTHYHVVYVKYGDEFMMFESINKPASH